MTDLISRKEAIALAKDICVPTKDGTVYKHRCIDPDAIKELPSVEPEIIRCKDCKYADEYCHCSHTTYWNSPDDFCSRAERRTDA